jgi:hypothetical protein
LVFECIGAPLSEGSGDTIDLLFSCFPAGGDTIAKLGLATEYPGVEGGKEVALGPTACCDVVSAIIIGVSLAAFDRVTFGGSVPGEIGPSSDVAAALPSVAEGIVCFDTAGDLPSKRFDFADRKLTSVSV